MNTNKILLILMCVVIAFAVACKHKAKVLPVEPEQPAVEKTKIEEVKQPQQIKEPGEQELYDLADLDKISKDFKDGFYDYDKYNIRDDQIANLQFNADYLKKWPKVRILIEGHCDERGTAEYNMALGSKRANAAKDYLVSLGIDASRIETISFGKEKPFATGHSEDSWWQNRRAHFVATAK